MYCFSVFVASFGYGFHCLGKNSNKVPRKAPMTESLYGQGAGIQHTSTQHSENKCHIKQPSADALAYF